MYNIDSAADMVSSTEIFSLNSNILNLSVSSCRPHDHKMTYGHFHYTCEDSHKLPEDVQETLLRSIVDFAVQVDVSQEPTTT